jgi:sec-independent protein translocase protein TatA
MYNFLLLDFTSPWHLLLIVVVVLILFGGKRLKDTMRGLGEGIKEFKKGMKDEEPKKEENTAAKPEEKKS